MFRILNSFFVLKRTFSEAVFTFGDHFTGKYSDTFQYWILKQFKNSSNYITHKVGGFNENQLQDFNAKLGSLSSDEILDFMCVKSGGIEPSLRKRLDNELKLRIHNAPASSDQLLSIVDTCIRVFPTHVTESVAYREALLKLEIAIATSDLPLRHKLQCMYYASVLKNSPASKKFLSIALNKLEPEDLKLLEDFELGIFCNSLYRSSVVVPNKFLVLVVTSLKSRLTHFLAQPAIFTSLIKALRHAKFYDHELFSSLSQNIRNNIQDFKLIARIHLLAYYSDALYNEGQLISDFVNYSLDDVEQLLRSKKHVRLKDIDRLLWSASNYNLESIKAKLNQTSIVDHICFLGKTEFKNRPEAIANALLWLWILESEKREELLCFITENNIRKIKGSRHFKHIARLYLLLTCISIEAPSSLPEKLFRERDNKLMPRVNNYLTNRPKLNRVLNTLKKNSSKLGLDEVKFEFKIPCLYIGGITVKSSRGESSIEVLDETVCLRESGIPHGRMQLKMRLLKAQGIPTHTINCNTVNSNSSNWIDNLEKWTVSNVQ